MKKSRKIVLIVVVVLACLFGGGYLGLQYLKSVLLSKITACELETKNFREVIDFEYVNNWIVVQVSAGESDKCYPFIFDTGAQTIIMDSLLSELEQDSYESLVFNKTTDTLSHAFNNRLITLKNLEIGAVKFKNIGTMTAKNDKWGMLNCISAYGIIGYNIIQNCAFQIDYEKQQIIITDQLDQLENYNEIQWMTYKPLSKLSYPIIPALIDDSMMVDLLFDTGMSGGLTLYSSQKYENFSKLSTDHIRKYSYRPSIRIRGEKNTLKMGLLYRSSKLLIGNNQTVNHTIRLINEPIRDYAGIIGNTYLENYIITLDYVNKRLGFIPNGPWKENNTTYGLSFLPFEDYMSVSAVYEDFEPEKQGIKPGDRIHSINGMAIADLQKDAFCKIYRRDYTFSQKQDSLLNIEIIRNDSILSYQLSKEVLF